MLDKTCGTCKFASKGEDVVQRMETTPSFSGLVGLRSCSAYRHQRNCTTLKGGRHFMFVVLPLAMTIYCIAIAIGVANGQEWAINNPTNVYQNSWFHYAKGICSAYRRLGFMVIKYHWGKLGKAHWFKAFFVIVAINILIAVVPTLKCVSLLCTWRADLGHLEGATQVVGWNNVFNIAGLLNIFCMTAWWSVYTSKDERDVLARYLGLHHRVRYLELLLPITPPHQHSSAACTYSCPTVINALWNKVAGFKITRWPSGVCLLRSSCLLREQRICDSFGT